MDNLIKPTEPQVQVEKTQTNSNKGGIFILIIFFGVLFGVVSGFGLTKVVGVGGGGAVGGKVNTKTEVGVNDSKTFNDEAEGKIVEGGINGEGTHHLVRPGGESQNVYLTSSTVDLSQFVGKNVKVFGQTNASETAGWFMDVGKVETK